MKKVWWRFTFSLMGLWMALTAQGNEAWPEADVKAAFIFNFSLFTEWPSVPETEYLVCQFKDDLFQMNNHMLQQKTLNGKPIKWTLVDHAIELKKCHIALIGHYKAQEIDSILSVLDNAPVLTVCDSSSPIAQKAMIRMVIENGMLGFEVNLKASKAANLQLSTRLIKLAKRINT